MNKHPSLSPVPQQHKGLDFHINSTSQPITPQTAPVPDIGISPDEWARMLKALHWASPDQPITNLTMSTSPTHTTFSILGLRESYRVGDELHVTIVAKDHNKNTKQYGGDFFQAKLFSSKLKASVFGEVLDHQNGSYSVHFLLPWVGEAQVAVRLIHSSEAVQVLKRHRDSNFVRTFYWGHYVGPGPNGTRMSEKVHCNIKWGQTGIQSLGPGNCCCEYQDPRTGEVWFCQRPQTLPCNTLVHHAWGDLKNPLNTFEKKLMEKSLTNRGINGDKHIINTLPSNASIGVKEKCQPGMRTPVTAGFYLNDVWTSLVCAAHHFKPIEAEQCLRGKLIYMLGDSTTRQWFEYLEHFLPTLKRMDLHTPPTGGPLMAVDVKNNIVLHWRPHAPPLRFHIMLMADLHYISNEIDELAGGPHMVIVINIFAHFVFHPLALYAHRVARIRQAVLALLRRAPETTVIIMSANTGHGKDVFASDWFALQLDTIMREAFRGVGVVFLDVWQMTSCHYTTESIHPKPVIIQNEMDIFLSFACPT